MSILIETNDTFINMKVGSANIAIAVPYSMLAEFKEVIKRGSAFGTQTSPPMKYFVDNLLERIEYTKDGNMLKHN